MSTSMQSPLTFDTIQVQRHTIQVQRRSCANIVYNTLELGALPIQYLPAPIVILIHTYIPSKRMQSLEWTDISVVPRPPCFLILRFAFSIIHGSRRARKTGKAWEHLLRELHQVDTRRWT